jgi:hypothetical protein
MQARYGTPCEHQWRRVDSHTRRYFRFGPLCVGRGGEAGSSPTPRLVYLNDQDREDLEELYKNDPDECRAYVASLLEFEE